MIQYLLSPRSSVIIVPARPGTPVYTDLGGFGFGLGASLIRIWAVSARPPGGVRACVRKRCPRGPGLWPDIAGAGTVRREDPGRAQKKKPETSPGNKQGRANREGYVALHSPKRCRLLTYLYLLTFLRYPPPPKRWWRHAHVATEPPSRRRRRTRPTFGSGPRRAYVLFVFSSAYFHFHRLYGSAPTPSPKMKTLRLSYECAVRANVRPYQRGESPRFGADAPPAANAWWWGGQESRVDPQACAWTELGACFPRAATCAHFISCCFGSVISCCPGFPASSGFQQNIV